MGSIHLQGLATKTCNGFVPTNSCFPSPHCGVCISRAGGTPLPSRQASLGGPGPRGVHHLLTFRFQTTFCSSPSQHREPQATRQTGKQHVFELSFGKRQPQDNTGTRLCGESMPHEGNLSARARQGVPEAASITESV